MIDLKYIQPRLKFNGGNGALLCNCCNTIIKVNLTEDEWNCKTDLLFCEECKKKLDKNSKNE
jgi:hypothetical protein